MSALQRITWRLWRTERKRWVLALLLACTVLAFGIALLGLAGWFITAAGLAGLLGLGPGFDIFRPSAGVRFLALGRTAARYGERLTTHGATLASLSTLRVALFERLLQRPLPELMQYRDSEWLNRLTADVDTLDALPLRLIVPTLAAFTTLVATWALLAWLCGWPLASWLVGSHCLGAVALYRLACTRAPVAAHAADSAVRTMRRRAADLIRGRIELQIVGRMSDQQRALQRNDRQSRRALARLNHLERRSTLLLQMTSLIAVAGTLGFGAHLLARNALDLAYLALAVFVSLALSEALAPLHRGLLAYGRYRSAAGRVDALLTSHASGELPSIPATMPGGDTDRSRSETAAEAPDDPSLVVRDLCVRRNTHHCIVNGFDLCVPAGQRHALVGPSGCGKSSVLYAIAGLLRIDHGDIAIGARHLSYPVDPAWRQCITLLPQRGALISGSIADCLRLAQPSLDSDALWALLESVALADTIHRRGGLDAMLGEQGAGFSGGERRRLALARALSRASPVLLLDEPTEGLDEVTAVRVLEGIDRLAPTSTILTASHRAVELDWVSMRHPLN